MAGAVDLFAGAPSIQGANIWDVDKSPLNQLSGGVEDMIGHGAKSTGDSVITSFESIIRAILGFAPGLPLGEGGLLLGSLENINKYFGNVEEFLGQLNPMDPNFDPQEAIKTFIADMLHPSRMLAPLLLDPNGSAGVVGFVPLENLALSAIAGVIGGAQEVIDAIMRVFGFPPGSATADNVDDVFTNIYAFLGNLDLSDVLMNPVQAIKDFITDMIHPVNMLGPMNPATRLLIPVNIPGLDATKITSGLFPQAQIQNLEDDLSDIWDQLIQSVFGPDSPLNAQNLFNQVPAHLLGMVSFSHVGQHNPNLLTIPGFDTTESVTPAPGWSWDGTDGRTSPGCAVSTAGGVMRTLVGNIIQVAAGQQLSLGAWLKWSGRTATAGQSAIRMSVQPYLGTALVGSPVMVASVVSPGASQASWTQITGNWTVPAGVDNFVVLLQLTAAATAGTVKWDDTTAVKNGLMSGDWMKALVGTVTQDIQSQVDQIWQAIKGGSSTGNPLTSIKNNLLNIPGPNIVTLILSQIVPGLDATKITSGLFPQNQIANLVTDMSNKALKSIVNSKALAGANLIVDPGFDNPDNWLYEPGTMSSEQWITAGSSRKQVADGTLKSISLTASGGPGTGGVWMVRGGAQFYLEASVFPKATNVGGGTIAVVCSVWDSTGVNTFTYVLEPYMGAPPTKGQWTTYSGYFNIPDGYDGMIPYVLVNSDVPVGDTFYWDRCVCKEVTRVGNSPDLQELTDHVLNGLIGGVGYVGAGLGSIPDMARGALDRIYKDVLNHTARLQELSSTENAVDNSGTTITLNFASYPDGNLPSIYTVTYSGSGTSLLGVTSGQGGWRTKVNDAKRSFRAAYNPGTTKTDFQIVRGTLGGLPEQGGSGGTPKIGVMGRLNSPTTPVTFVWGRGYCSGFLSYKGEMGCTVNNVETVWVSNISLNWSMDIRCVFGVGINPRRYQFYSGGELIYDYTEVGTVSQLGAGFRYFGLTGDICTASGGPKVPGTLANAAISDNAPPTLVGSGAHMSKRTTNTATLASGVNLFPNNFFTQIDSLSEDITASTVDGSFIVSKDGWYSITSGVMLSSGISQDWNVVVFVNGIGVKAGGAKVASQSAAGSSWSVYLAAGDKVQMGTFRASSSSSVLGGDSSGMWTYFSICLANRSYA
jgi:hypothetical protein